MDDLVTIKVKRETLKPLRIAIVKRYGMLYGFLKKEINNALLEHAKKLEEESKNV